METRKKITIGFGVHRDAKRWLKQMKKADMILLEQPKKWGFKEMIKGQISPTEFIEKVEKTEIHKIHNDPSFSRGLYRGLQELNAKGKKIMPILPATVGKPWLGERLLESEIKLKNALHRGNFDDAVKAVQENNRTIHEINKAEDGGRVEWVAENIEHMPPRIFMEAGIAHTGLLNELKKKLYGRNTIVEPVYLDRAKAEKQFGKGTQKAYPQPVQLRRYLERKKILPERARLLAARTLIYAAIEGASKRKDRPEKDYKNISFVNKLSERECRAMFNIMWQNPRTALDLNKLRKQISANKRSY